MKLLRNKIRATLFFLIIAAAGASASPAPGGFYALRGHVVFKDSTETPGAFATVYCESLRKGTTADEKGAFIINVPVSDGGRNITLEYSYMGYETVIQKVVLGDETSLNLPAVYLKPQTLLLPAAYVTPGFENFAEYLLTQVSRKAKENKSRYPDYDMDVEYTVQTHELSMVTEVFPKFTVGLARMAVGFMGYAPIINYALKHDDFFASVALRRSVRGDKAEDYDARIIKSNAELPRNVQNNLTTCFSLVHLYSLLYSDKAMWGRNNFKKFPFTVVGSYERGDNFVHVLRWYSKNGDLSATVHVIDGDWGILKVEAGYSDRVVRCEAREVADGLYMPVSLTISPNLFPVIKPEDIEKAMDYVRNNKDLDKASKRRILKFLGSREGQEISPYILGSFSVNYTDVKQ